MKVDSLETKPVIYTIKCKINEKIYVGKTKHHLMRLAQHSRDLMLNKHHCPELQNDYNLHGANNFIFEVLQVVDNDDNLELLEIKFISSFDVDRLYNASLTKKQVAMYDITTGNVLATFFNVSEAAKILNISYILITDCCKNRGRHSASGKGFCYESDIHTIPQRILPPNKPKTMREKQTVIQIDPITKLEIKRFSSIHSASKKTGVHDSTISACCKGKRLTAGKFIWCYADKKESISKIVEAKLLLKSKIKRLTFKRKPVIQIDPTTNVEIKKFSSMTEASKEIGITYPTISDCCRGKLKTAGGFIWRYADSTE